MDQPGDDCDIGGAQPREPHVCQGEQALPVQGRDALRGTQGLGEISREKNADRSSKHFFALCGWIAGAISPSSNQSYQSKILVNHVKKRKYLWWHNPIKKIQQQQIHLAKFLIYWLLALKLVSWLFYRSTTLTWIPRLGAPRRRRPPPASPGTYRSSWRLTPLWGWNAAKVYYSRKLSLFFFRL